MAGLVFCNIVFVCLTFRSRKAPTVETVLKVKSVAVKTAVSVLFISVAFEPFIVVCLVIVVDDSTHAKMGCGNPLKSVVSIIPVSSAFAVILPLCVVKPVK